MICRICGSPIKEGEKFCSLCGEKIETPEEIQQDQAQQPYSQTPYSRQSDSGQPYGQRESRQSYRRQANNQQPYGQGENRQSYRRQANNQQPYGQYFDQPFGQQPRGNLYYSVPTKSRKGLWVTLSLVAVAAVAAVLIFTVFGDKQSISQGPEPTPPFKGDTLQTKLANDTVRVYSDSLSILGNRIDFIKLLEQPFDIKVDTTVKVMGQSINTTLNAAYDNETFGMNMNAEGDSVKMLLIEDVLYMDMLGSVNGIDLNSSADLTIPMSLGDRLIALAFGGNPPQNILIENDYIALAELFINSIDESCFESSGSKITLTLHIGDIANTLRTFAGKLEENDELKITLENLILYFSETPIDIIKQINEAADSLEKQKDAAGFEIVWEVSYKDEKPVSVEIKADDGVKEYSLSYSYEQNEDGTDVMVEFVPGNISDAISEFYNYKKRGSGVEFVGTTYANGQTQTISGCIEFSDNTMHGTETINIPGIGEEIIDFNLTLNMGMPNTKVKDDGRFKIDTGDATIIDATSIFDSYGLPGLY